MHRGLGRNPAALFRTLHLHGFQTYAYSRSRARHISLPPSDRSAPSFSLIPTMTKKPFDTPPLPDINALLSGSVKDSAQQIWQAGLGAFAKAQAEGTKAFEALVKEGTVLQRKTQVAAEEKISEASAKMNSMASDMGARASGQWDKLETIFEDRVAKALNKLGVPSAKDINALIARLDALNASVQKLTESQTARTDATAPKAARKPAAKKSASTSSDTVRPATVKTPKKSTAKRAAATPKSSD
jgi:poly(hydroxyalkanoate) granule-associated protein